VRDVDFEDFLGLAGARGHDRHLVAQENRLFEIVGDEEDRDLVAVVDLEQRLVHHRLGERVERAVGLVEQQHLRLVHQRAHDLDAPAHPGRHFARIVVLDAGEPGVGHHRARLLGASAL
jgi:hypothetical protein